jgi:hypothetical protein
MTPINSRLWKIREKWGGGGAQTPALFVFDPNAIGQKPECDIA